jgi:hypothetical protein
MPTDCSTDLFGFTEVEGREVVAAFDGGAITSDAGAYSRARRQRLCAGGVDGLVRGERCALSLGIGQESPVDCKDV